MPIFRPKLDDIDSLKDEAVSLLGERFGYSDSSYGTLYGDNE